MGIGSNEWSGEVEELRVLTRVTQLRRQIECRGVGEWIDEEGARRQVTSYSRASRSVVKSIKSVESGAPIPSGPVVELAEDEGEASGRKSGPDTVEIIEVVEEKPPKKTSVVTLGKGNIVLLDASQGEISVTGLAEERVENKPEKKQRKVEFCKTEVHFTQEPGKFSIVETNEKPPPTQIYRRRRKTRSPPSNLPKVYFGDLPTEAEAKPKLKFTKDANISNYLAHRDSLTLAAPVKLPVDIPSTKETSFGNISPKLRNLIQNSEGLKLKIKPEQEVKESKETEEEAEEKPEKPVERPSRRTLHDRNLRHKSASPTPRKPLTLENGNLDDLKSWKVISHIRHRSASPTPSVPKLPPRNTTENSPPSNEVIIPIEKEREKDTLTKTSRKIERPPRARQRPKTEETPKPVPAPRVCSRKDVKTPTKQPIEKQPSKVIVHKTQEKVIKSGNVGSKLEKLIVSSIKAGVNTMEDSVTRVRRSKEPLKSFEKVSNGWVGHCIVPISVENHRKVNGTANPPPSKPQPRAHPPKSVENKSNLAGKKQFSLSKEHLKSVSLVRETLLSKQRLAEGRCSQRRRDSEQSDDSLLRADEEVKNFMFKDVSDMTASYSEICERPTELDLPIEEEGESSCQSVPKVLNFLSQLEGTVTQHGDMISFVADNLETKIKLSSPRSEEQELSWSLADIEADALRVAASVDSLTENLSDILHGISALTVDCLETYRDSVCKTCDALDLNIKSMYQLMAKCEELSKSMAPTYKLASHIKNIKHLLDLIEAS